MPSVRRCFCPRRQLRFSLLVKVELIVLLITLIYATFLWFDHNNNATSSDISSISELQDEIHNLNVDDVVFQGEDGELYRSEEDFILRQFNNSSYDDSDTNIKQLIEEEKPRDLLGNNINNLSPRSKVKDPTILQNTFSFKTTHTTHRFLFILGHYEQLGKTTINFFHARHLASLMKRDLVVPYVRNSRLCGLKEGWIGPKRKKSREFFSMQNYFDMSSVEQISPVTNIARLLDLGEYYEECRGTGISMIYFVYSANKLETKKYLHLTDEEYEDLIVKMSKHNGWLDCSFIEKKLHSRRRLSDIKLIQAVCIDPEVIVSVNALEELVHNSKCASIFLWRGIGKQRTHFNLTFSESHAFYLSQIKFSKLIGDEVEKFLVANFQTQPFISIQIRSERQLAWYSLKKFKQCIDLVVKVVNILVVKKKIRHIFVSSDLEKHGSDQISLLLNKTTQDEATKYFYETVKLVQGVLYKPDKSRGLIYNDAGFVALTQMEILAQSRHLITIGDGTFQRWLVALFKKNKKTTKRSWSLTRVCATELKKSQSRKPVTPVSDHVKI